MKLVEFEDVSGNKVLINPELVGAVLPGLDGAIVRIAGRAEDILLSEGVGDVRSKLETVSPG